MSSTILGLTILSFVIWVGLLTVWGNFWRADQRLGESEGSQDAREENLPSNFPSVCAVIPARNEADMLPMTLRSLLSQDYLGPFSIILVDDHSTDGTAQVARQTAQALNRADQLDVLSAEPLPKGWTGKLWALEQGTRYGQQRTTPAPDYFLLTDADIQHDPSNLRQLIAKAEAEKLDLTSLMVLLRCQSFWERFLIPAFVFFFQKLYPFPLVNDPRRKMAAAAGGCILIRRPALNDIGGIAVVRDALIDDCSLAHAVKSKGQTGQNTPTEINSPDPSSPETSALTGRIWLGLTNKTKSLRPYPQLDTIWTMVARTAYTQLHYSPLLLVGALLGMVLVYWVAPIALIWGLVTGTWAVAGIAVLIWVLMAIAYCPTVKLYGISLVWSFSLPAIAFLYMLMTMDSALRHWQGRGGAWKGRVYSD